MVEGILLLNKPKHKTSFYLVHLLRKVTGVKKIGHGGTLDPLAVGVMVLLIGKRFTTTASQFLTHDKEYRVRILLGTTTDSYDIDGNVTATNTTIPSIEAITQALAHFQGDIEQIPPMVSAKKHQGKKLYELARQGISIDRQPVRISLTTTLLAYNYPHLDLQITCSKGTYIRSIANDLGIHLGCGGTVLELTRLRSGPFSIDQCLSTESLTLSQITSHLIPLPLPNEECEPRRATGSWRPHG